MSKNIEYRLLRASNGREVYATDISSLVSDFNDGAETTFYEVCPVCRDRHRRGEKGFYLDPHYNKRKLGVMPDLSMAHCNRCDALFIDSTDECKTFIPKFNFNLGIYEDFNVVKLKGVGTIMDKSSRISDAMREILKLRNPKLDPDVIGMRTLKGWDRPNILTPFYHQDEIIYYQLRFLDSEEPKYFMPSIKNKPPFIPKGCNGDKIMICEGVYDALAILSSHPDYVPFAILGSHITPYHINYLRKYMSPSEIAIFMDETSISEEIKEDILRSPLSFYIDEPDIIESDGLDPEECLRVDMGLPSSINIAEEYENIIRRSSLHSID